MWAKKICRLLLIEKRRHKSRHYFCAGNHDQATWGYWLIQKAMPCACLAMTVATIEKKTVDGCEEEGQCIHDCHGGQIAAANYFQLYDHAVMKQIFSDSNGFCG